MRIKQPALVLKR